MYKYFFLFLLICLGCSEDPNNVRFNDETLTNILVEMHIAEASVSIMSKDSMDLKRKQYMLKIAQIYDTTIPDIEANIAEMQKRTDRLKPIQAAVIKSLKELNELSKSEK